MIGIILAIILLAQLIFLSFIPKAAECTVYFIEGLVALVLGVIIAAIAHGGILDEIGGMLLIYSIGCFIISFSLAVDYIDNKG